MVTGTISANGIERIERIERTDKTFVPELQFYPEAAVVKNLEPADNKDRFMSDEEALKLFQSLAGPQALAEAA